MPTSIVVLRMLSMCGVPLLTVIVGNAVLLLVDPASEAVQAVNKLGSTQGFAFIVGFIAWSISAWGVCRILLRAKYPYDAVGAGDTALTKWLATWIPRVTGMLACLPLAAFALSWNSYFGIVFFVIAICLAAFFYWRQRLFVQPQSRESYYRADSKLPAIWHYFAWFIILASVLITVLIACNPVAVGRYLGSPALLLLALASWTFIGGILLNYWPKMRGRPSLLWLLPVVFLAFSPFNNNHRVGTSPDIDPVSWRAARPLLKDHWDCWMKQHDPKQPVYFVAMAGGATRAAYWSASLLAQIEDETRNQTAQKKDSTRPLSSNIYMISGVSGGSVGAATYVSALSAMSSGEDNTTSAVETMLGHDALAPVLGMMLFPDGIQRLIPFSFDLLDRSRGLEEGWIGDWRALSTERHWSEGNRELWARPLTGLYLKDAADVSAVPSGDTCNQPAMQHHLALPSVVLNTVRLEDGRRMLQSNLAFALPAADDLFADNLDTHNISLAQAVHNSARFPYISPGGQVFACPQGHCMSQEAGEDEHSWGSLGDGGYAEASGAATIADLLDKKILEGRVMRTPIGLKARACSNDVCTEQDLNSPLHPIVLLMIDNAPIHYPGDAQRLLDDKITLPPASRRMPSPPVVEATLPIFGLASGRSGAGLFAQQRLSDMVPAAVSASTLVPDEKAAKRDQIGFIELRLPVRAQAKEQPSLTWFLNENSRTAMTHAASGAGRPCSLADEAFLKNLNHLRVSANLRPRRALEYVNCLGDNPRKELTP